MVWADVLGLDANKAQDDPHDVTAGLHQIREEIDILGRLMKGHPFSPDLYHPYLENVRKMVSVTNMSAGWSQYRHYGNAETILALRYCSEIIASEEVIQHEALQELLDEINRFRQEIEELEIPGSAKDFLLHQLKIMEQGIQAYPVQGNRGIRESFKRGVGDAHTVDQTTVDQAGPAPTSTLLKLWAAMKNAARGVDGVDKLLASLNNALTNGNALIDQVSRLPPP
jgi:hypothetical protein